jgi:hypothetical protein
MRRNTRLHALLVNMSSIHYSLCGSREQRILRCLLHECALCQSGWDCARRAQPPRARVSPNGRLEAHGQRTLLGHVRSTRAAAKAEPPAACRASLQCTQEVLQAYYANLVRTCPERFYFAGTRDQTPAPTSEPTAAVLSSDSDGDSEMASRPASRAASPAAAPGALLGATTGLASNSTAAPPAARAPTLEQTMAFQALRQSEEHD